MGTEAWKRLEKDRNQGHCREGLGSRRVVLAENQAGEEGSQTVDLDKVFLKIDVNFLKNFLLK